MKKKCVCTKFSAFCLTKNARLNLIKIARKEGVSMNEVINRIVEAM